MALFYYSHAGLPIFIIPLLPQIIDVEHGLPLTLTCTAENTPEVQDLEFMWLYNGIEVVENSRITISTSPEVNDVANSSLIFSPAFQSDTGDYTCQVNNREVVDAVSRTVELNVTGEQNFSVQQMYCLLLTTTVFMIIPLLQHFHLTSLTQTSQKIS